MGRDQPILFQFTLKVTWSTLETQRVRNASLFLFTHSISAFASTLQKTGLETHRSIIKEVRGHFLKMSKKSDVWVLCVKIESKLATRLTSMVLETEISGYPKPSDCFWT